MEILIGILVLGVVALNVAASVYISKAPAYEPIQKKFQIVIIWLLPILGAAFCSYFLWNDRKNHKYEKKVGNNTAFSSSDEINHHAGANHGGGR